MGTFFSDHDLLLTPTLGALPAPLGTYDPTAPMPPIEMFAAWSRHESFLPVFNATGQPAISLPLAMSASGLPIGMQLVGRFGSEALLLRVAAVLEQALPWAGRTPALHASRLARSDASPQLRRPLSDGHVSVRRSLPIEAGMHLRNGEHGYGAVTKALHWLTVAAIAAQFFVGYTMETEADVPEVDCDPPGDDR